MPRRCALGCTPTRGVLHVFPNPDKFPDQFKAWVKIVSGKTECDFDYTKKRVCDRHFTEKDRNRNNRLNKLAIPSLFLPFVNVDEQVRVTDTLREAEAGSSTSNTMSVEPTTSTQVAGYSACGVNVDEQVRVTDTLREAEAGSSTSNTMSVEPTTSTELAGYSACVVNVDEQVRVTDTLREAEAGSSTSNTMSIEPTTSTQLAGYSACDLINAGTSKVPDTLSEAEPGHSTSVTTSMNPKKHTQKAPDVKRKRNVSRKPSAATSNRIKTYMKKIKNLRREIYRLRQKGKSFKVRLAAAEQMYSRSEFEKMTKHLSMSSKIFTRMQYFEAGKKPKGRRFKIEEKILSLSLYKRSPKCYTLLSKYFVLPSSKSLKRLLAQIKIGSGINTNVFEKLKKTVGELKMEDRLCTLIFDEMSISPQIHYDSSKDEIKGFTSYNTESHDIANHALVFMIKGVRKQYKQPVAYYFTNSIKKGDLKKITKEVITCVQRTGLTILCTVCDQSTVNVSTINDLVEETKATYLRRGIEMKYIFFEVNNQKIIPLYDVPHLLKGLRNNLLTKTMIYEDYTDNNKKKEVKWEYFQMLYAADKSSGELRCLQKLTEEHINPEKIKKMRVKSAAQIFSHSVATTTDHLTARGKLDEKCRAIIPLVLLIDNVFDSLNSNSFQIPNGKIYKGPVRRQTPHHDLWQTAIKCFKTMKFTTMKKEGNKVRVVETVVPSIKNFIKTIEGFQALWKIMSQQYRFDALLTRNFNQDPIENFFGNIRNCGARNVAPNCIAFEGAFKSLLLNSMNAPHSAHANCEEDVNQYLQSLQFLVTEKETIPSGIAEESGENAIIEYRTEFLFNDDDHDLGQRNYVCGWVLAKCLKNIIKNCKECRKNIVGDDNNPNNAYIKAKEFNKDKKWLVYPSAQMEQVFQDVQNIIITHLKKNVPKKDLKKNIRMYTSIFVQYPFQCELHNETLKEYFENVTINLLIFSWCRSINRIISGKLTYHDGDDELKLIAQKYYDKHKHNKTNK